MSLRDIVVNGVAVANAITAPLQVPVIHKAWIGQDPWGEPQYASQSTSSTGGVLTAAVVLKQSLRVKSDGTTVQTKAHVTFAQQVPVNGTAGRTEPIDPR